MLLWKYSKSTLENGFCWKRVFSHWFAALQEPLLDGLKEVSKQRPKHPISFLANYLYQFTNKSTKSDPKKLAEFLKSLKKVATWSHFSNVHDNSNAWAACQLNSLCRQQMVTCNLGILVKFHSKCKYENLLVQWQVVHYLCFIIASIY